MCASSFSFSSFLRSSTLGFAFAASMSAGAKPGRLSTGTVLIVLWNAKRCPGAQFVGSRLLHLVLCVWSFSNWLRLSLRLAYGASVAVSISLYSEGEKKAKAGFIVNFQKPILHPFWMYPSHSSQTKRQDLHSAGNACQNLCSPKR